MDNAAHWDRVCAYALTNLPACVSHTRNWHALHVWLWPIGFHTDKRIQCVQKEKLRVEQVAGRLAAPWALSVAAYQIWEHWAWTLSRRRRRRKRRKTSSENDSKLAAHRQKTTKQRPLLGIKEVFIITSQSFYLLSSDDWLPLALIEKKTLQLWFVLIYSSSYCSCACDLMKAGRWDFSKIIFCQPKSVKYKLVSDCFLFFPQYVSVCIRLTPAPVSPPLSPILLSASVAALTHTKLWCSQLNLNQEQ